MAPLFRCLAAVALAATALGVGSPARADEDSDAGAASASASASAPWCAGDLETLPGEVCAFTPPRLAAGPRTLVVFLHGVIKPDTTWQWAQQRGAARAAAQHGFTVIMPRGRRGIGPPSMEDWWTWPTSASAQAAVEDDVVAEWTAAQTLLEKRAGKPFDRIWIFGFSNGGYYTTSLAMRGKLPVQGYAAFAGGSAAPYLRIAGARTKRRAPFYLAWGEQDPAHGDQQKLAKMLRDLRWKAKASGSRRAGHVMADAQVAEAVAFLGR
jgi:predicted esterase